MKKTILPTPRIGVIIFFLAICICRTEAQWVQTNSPATSAVHCFAILGARLFAGTENGLYISNDNGQDWTLVSNNGFPNGRVYSLAVGDSTIFAGTDEGVAISSDSGRTWYSPANELSFSHILALAANGRNIFAGSIDSGAYRSTDNGTSWTSINNGLPSLNINALITKDTNLFAISGTGNADNASVYLLSNNGTKWIRTNLPDSCIALAIAVNGINLYAGTSKGFFRSTDNGVNWTSLNTGLTNTIVISLAADGTNIFAGTYGDGVFLSTDNGANWTSVSKGLIDSTIKVFMVSGSNIFAGAYDFSGGIFRRSLSEMINSNSVSRISLSSFSLQQNIPNPFSTATTVHYFLPTRERVQITLSNMLGEKKKTLVDEDADEGEHTLMINSNEFASGMYVLRANAGGEDKSVKINILK